MSTENPMRVTASQVLISGEHPEEVTFIVPAKGEKPEVWVTVPMTLIEAAKDLTCLRDQKLWVDLHEKQVHDY